MRSGLMPAPRAGRAWRAVRQRALPSALFGLGFLAYLVWQLHPASLGVFAYNYDEGVYLQTAWALAQGHELYYEIFNSQPPLFPYLLSRLFAIIDPSVIAARAVVVGLSLAALAGVILLTQRGGGWPAGLAAAGLLALNPHFAINARTVSPEIPALALAYLAVGLVVASPRPRAGHWLAAGLLLALASLTKLSALVVLPAFVVVLPWPPHAGRFYHRLAGAIVGLVLPALVLWGFALANIDRAEALDQMLGFRAGARQAYGLSVIANLDMAAAVFQGQSSLWLMATIGVLALVRRRQWRLLAAVMVLLLSVLIALMTYSPLFDHHLVLLVPPLAALGGVGLAAAGVALGQLLRAGRSAIRRPAVVLPVAVLIVALALTPGTLLTLDEETPDVAQSWAEPAQAIAALESLPDHTDLVLIDDQMIAFVADLAVPPEFVDTSRVRISAGYLTLDELIERIEAEQPDAILFWSGRLQRIPGFRPWVRQHYHLYQALGDGRELYVREDF